MPSTQQGIRLIEKVQSMGTYLLINVFRKFAYAFSGNISVN